MTILNSYHMSVYRTGYNCGKGIFGLYSSSYVGNESVLLIKPAFYSEYVNSMLTLILICLLILCPVLVHAFSYIASLEQTQMIPEQLQASPKALNGESFLS